GNACVHVENRGNHAERVLARRLFVVDERGGQVALVAPAADDIDGSRFFDPVYPVRAGVDGRPREEAREATRRDRAELGRSLRRVRELTCRAITERVTEFVVLGHEDSALQRNGFSSADWADVAPGNDAEWNGSPTFFH